MTHLILRLEQIVQHSRGFFFHLCAVCGRELGPAHQPLGSLRVTPCEHGAELLEQARLRPLGQPLPLPERSQPVLGRAPSLAG